jgi:hypothetical protein
MIYKLIATQAEIDVECGNGMQSKEEFFNFLATKSIQPLDKYYKYYLKCYNSELDLLCEWAEAVAGWFA